MTGLPDPITPGVYETRGGEIAHVTRIDRRFTHPARGWVKAKYFRLGWKLDGSLIAEPLRDDLIRRIGDLP